MTEFRFSVKIDTVKQIVPMSTIATTPEPKENAGKQPASLTKKLQTYLTEEAHQRLRVYSAAHEIPIGRLISEWAEQHLPAVGVAA